MWDIKKTIIKKVINNKDLNEKEEEWLGSLSPGEYNLLIEQIRDIKEKELNAIKEEIKAKDLGEIHASIILNPDLNPIGISSNQRVFTIKAGENIELIAHSEGVESLHVNWFLNGKKPDKFYGRINTSTKSIIIPTSHLQTINDQDLLKNKKTRGDQIGVYDWELRIYDNNNPKRMAIDKIRLILLRNPKLDDELRKELKNKKLKMIYIGFGDIEYSSGTLIKKYMLFLDKEAELICEADDDLIGDIVWFITKDNKEIILGKGDSIKYTFLRKGGFEPGEYNISIKTYLEEYKPGDKEIKSDSRRIYLREESKVSFRIYKQTEFIEEIKPVKSVYTLENREDYMIKAELEENKWESKNLGNEILDLKIPDIVKHLSIEKSKDKKVIFCRDIDPGFTDGDKINAILLTKDKFGYEDIVKNEIKINVITLNKKEEETPPKIKKIKEVSPGEEKESEDNEFTVEEKETIDIQLKVVAHDSYNDKTFGLESGKKMVISTDVSSKLEFIHTLDIKPDDKKKDYFVDWIILGEGKPKENISTFKIKNGIGLTVINKTPQKQTIIFQVKDKKNNIIYSKVKPIEFTLEFIRLNEDQKIKELRRVYLQPSSGIEERLNKIVLLFKEERELFDFEEDLNSLVRARENLAKEFEAFTKRINSLIDKEREIIIELESIDKLLKNIPEEVITYLKNFININIEVCNPIINNYKMDSKWNFKLLEGKDLTERVSILNDRFLKNIEIAKILDFRSKNIQNIKQIKDTIRFMIK